MTSVPLLVVAGFAGWLDTNGVASWHAVSGPYTTDTDWPIYPGPEVHPTPHQLITVTPTTIERRGADILQGVQVRLRGMPDEGSSPVVDKAQEIADLCYPNGFPRVHVQLGFIRAAAILNGPETLLGADVQRRVEYVLNYRIRHRRPSLSGPAAEGYTLVVPPPFVNAADLEAAIAAHVADPTPHPAYDDIPDLTAEYEDGPA